MVTAPAVAVPVLLLVAWVLTLVHRLRWLAVRTAAARVGLRVALVRWAATAQVAGVQEAAPVLAEPFGPDGVNALTAALAGAPGADLAEAQLRVALARRIYDDAVRDTRTLHAHRVVRLLRLGRGPLPGYFDIADPAAAVTARSVRAA